MDETKATLEPFSDTCDEEMVKKSHKFTILKNYAFKTGPHFGNMLNSMTIIDFIYQNGIV